MGFDKDDPRRLVDVHKRTTRVNVWMAALIVVFFLIAAGVVWFVAHRPPSSALP